MNPLQLILQYYLTFIMPMIITNVNILHLGVLFQQQSGVSQVGFRRVAYNSPEIVGIAWQKVASHSASDVLSIIFCAR